MLDKQFIPSTDEQFDYRTKLARFKKLIFGLTVILIVTCLSIGTDLFILKPLNKNNNREDFPKVIRAIEPVSVKGYKDLDLATEIKAQEIKKSVIKEKVVKKPIQAVSQSCQKGVYNSASLSNTPSPTNGFQALVDEPQTYLAYGNTAQEVRNQINGCRVGSYDAYTSWYGRWNYVAQPTSEGLCKVGSANVIVHITSIYPKWIKDSQAAPGLESKWNTYIGNLTTHENGHRDRSVDTIKSFYTDLLSFPETDCNMLYQALSDHWNQKSSQLRNAQSDYDTETNHGGTQGAYFP